MAAATILLDQRLTMAAFDDVARAVSVIDRLFDAGVPRSALGMLLSDRTAERHFAALRCAGHSQTWRARGRESMFSVQVTQLTRRLTPLAEGATPGAGLVGVGPLPAALVSAGLGGWCSLKKALMHLGVEPGCANEVALRVCNGGVLLSAFSEDSTGARLSTPLLRRESALSVQLDLAEDPGRRVTLAQLA